MLYPLRFQPIFRHYLWGGHRLARELGKTVPAEQTCAESWEIVDRGVDQSHVAFGGLRGASLGELTSQFGRELLGRHDPLPRFPLLFKYLDAEQTLSVQVHPSDAYAAQLDPPDLGKTEAWVVLSAEPSSRIYAGLRPGIDRQQFVTAIREGRVETTLHAFHPRNGDCVFLPSGIMHALGGGLLVAEIQQSSDATFRVFDWNRVGPDGTPRPLHIEQALAVTNFGAGPIEPIRASHEPATSQSGLWREELVRCDKFVLERWQVHDRVDLETGDRFHLLAVLEGAVELIGDPAQAPLGRGQTALWPACLPRLSLIPRVPSTLLLVCLP
ncbi:MAG TPA: type I phosphomannose isomerase catalytic subunit [Pirellulaceae bacterium]